MTKIVYNACYGGFSLSPAACDLYNELTGAKVVPYDEVDRADPTLALVIERLGEAANGACADLSICELEPGERYRIQEYDGLEFVETPDQIKWRIA